MISSVRSSSQVAYFSFFDPILNVHCKSIPINANSFKQEAYKISTGTLQFSIPFRKRIFVQLYIA
jgi:hypothetical protein